ncbi:DUF2231 domain-containing protein [Candidatus Chlorohelix sp.]|uniref:DUF2231 domain-containing protein n=1 Tax=Candidatus Chlorohelix sp. TaxID=3139201 RepID=UPI003056A859
MTPYGAPLHPLLVHFPIALLIAGVVAGFVASFPKLGWLRVVELVLMAVGGIAALVARQTGEDNAERFMSAIRSSGASTDIYQTHKLFANLTIVAFGLLIMFRLAIWGWFLWRDRQKLSELRNTPLVFLSAIFARTQNVPVLLLIVYLLGALVAVGFLSATGYYGGELVFTYGIGIK